MCEGKMGQPAMSTDAHLYGCHQPVQSLHGGELMRDVSIDFTHFFTEP
jgi:hypothetical protein